MGVRHDFTHVQLAILERFGHRCASCGREDLPLPQRGRRLNLFLRSGARDLLGGSRAVTGRPLTGVRLPHDRQPGAAQGPRVDSAGGGGARSSSASAGESASGHRSRGRRNILSVGFVARHSSAKRTSRRRRRIWGKPALSELHAPFAFARPLVVAVVNDDHELPCPVRPRARAVDPIDRAEAPVGHLDDAVVHVN